MDSERNEKYINMVINLIDEFDDVNFVLSNEVAFEVVERLELIGIRFNEVEPTSFSEFREMFNSDKLIISKSTFGEDIEYWFEDANGNNGIKDMGFEECISFIEEGVLTKDQIKQHIEGKVAIVTEDKNSECKSYESLEKFRDNIKREIMKELIDLLEY